MSGRRFVSGQNGIGEQNGAKPITVAVVGLGYWGPNLFRVLSDMPGVEVTWICDLDEDRLTRYVRRHPSVQTTMTIAELLEDPDLDAVFLATPVYTHFDLASRCLRAGKHTFVEKPLAPSSAMAAELITLGEETGLTLMCGHTFLYSPPVRAVRDLLDAKELGDIFFVTSSRVNLGLHQSDVSVIWDLGPHDFSILLYWLGEVPATVRAVGRDSVVPGIADVAFITLTYDSGIVANVELSWLAPSKLRRTVIVGSKKMVVYDDGTSEPVRVFDHGVVYKDPETFGEYHLSYRTGDITSPRVDTAEPLMAEVSDFLGAARRGVVRHEFAEIARNVVVLLAAADHSLREGGELVPLDEWARTTA